MAPLSRDAGADAVRRPPTVSPALPSWMDRRPPQKVDRRWAEWIRRHRG